MTVEVSSQPQMIEVDRPTFFKAQHSREFSGMDVSTSMIRSHVFLKQSCERSLYTDIDEEDEDEPTPPYSEWQPIQEWILTQKDDPISVEDEFPLF